MCNRRCITALVLAICASLSAHAEFILDDFDDPAATQLPEMESTVVLTEGIGPLNARRGIFAFGNSGNLVGSFDSSVSANSQLTANITGLEVTNVTATLDFRAEYQFAAPIDFTQSGVNDAFFIDMTTFQGPDLPHYVVGYANDAFLGYVLGHPFPANAPHTIVLPFEKFGYRGIVRPGTADILFPRISEVTVSLFLTTGFTNPDQQWFVQIDRIRVGRMVPEPSMWRLAVLPVIVAVSARWQTCKRLTYLGS